MNQKSHDRDSETIYLLSLVIIVILLIFLSVTIIKIFDLHPKNSKIPKKEIAKYDINIENVSSDVVIVISNGKAYYKIPYLKPEKEHKGNKLGETTEQHLSVGKNNKEVSEGACCNISPGCSYYECIGNEGTIYLYNTKGKSTVLFTYENYLKYNKNTFSELVKILTLERLDIVFEDKQTKSLDKDELNQFMRTLYPSTYKINNYSTDYEKGDCYFYCEEGFAIDVTAGYQPLFDELFFYDDLSNTTEYLDGDIEYTAYFQTNASIVAFD